MANPRGINGTDVVLVVDGIQIPAQRSASQTEKVATIDMSSKDSPGMRRAPGRYDSSLALTALYLPGASGFDALRTAFRDRQYVDVIRYEPSTQQSWPAGWTASGVEMASCIITDMSPQFPDQDASTISLTLEVDDTWGPIV